MADWRKSSYSGGANNDCVEVGTDWRKSSYSGGSTNDCVEVGTGNAVLVRDTKDRQGVTLAFGASAWHPFVTRLRGQ